MTQKEKAELCDKAYDKVAARFGLNVANEIFTGLKESEDERIRKALIQLVNQCGEELLHPENARQMLDWLEKQGEKLPVGFYYVNSEGKKFYSDTFKYGDVTLHVEKQGEQKPIDKVEPKFKVGDWIVYNRDDCSREIIQVYDIRDSRYYFTNNVHFSWSIKECDEKSHLWTIQDAKDGDVLAYVTDEEDLWIMIYWSLYEPYEGHVHYHALLVNDNFSNKGTCCICIDNLKPATKEQRDQLEKAMAGAGWEFDFEKKELKKIHVIDEGKSEMDYCFTKMMNGEKVSPI